MLDNFLDKFLLPVLVGVITTSLIFIVKEFILRSALPWFRGKMDKGHSLSGTWSSTFTAIPPDKGTWRETIDVKQNARDVYGDIIAFVEHGEDQTHDTANFKFLGHYENNVLVATFRCTNRSELGRGTFCLVPKNSDLLKGVYTWFNYSSGKPVTIEYEWVKK